MIDREKLKSENWQSSSQAGTKEKTTGKIGTLANQLQKERELKECMQHVVLEIWIVGRLSYGNIFQWEYGYKFS